MKDAEEFAGKKLVAVGRKPSGNVTPDGSRRSAKKLKQISKE
ncbi:DUF1584 domain-containing protein [Rubripirellula reticaptiva]|uniref:Uncharacterized protein n=1 Tax=Rubripirellula reticaptiva TaxID=2528013 RepID=A0A5C6EC92_9BACT|nr:DUF1584 domain-containing protein [Rubripirellula reticaptiva]TWU46612.1 hypothetical protein Poly59_55850 [Rubripirellula reticaptiva]